MKEDSEATAKEDSDATGKDESDATAKEDSGATAKEANRDTPKEDSDAVKKEGLKGRTCTLGLKWLRRIGRTENYKGPSQDDCFNPFIQGKPPLPRLGIVFLKNRTKSLHSHTPSGSL